MDTDHDDAEGGDKSEDLVEEESESDSLLLPDRKSDKSRRKVNWNDNKGNQLAEVLIYDPSDDSDSDDEDADSCFCAIM